VVLGELGPERPHARPHDRAADADAVRLGDRGGRLEPPPQLRRLGAEVRIERQLSLDHERRHEHDARAAVSGEPAGEVERVLRLLALEERHDDAPVGDRPCSPREPARAAARTPDVRPSHRSSWYGTEARTTCGSNRSSRFR
jgi:hypothetical protein